VFHICSSASPMASRYGFGAELRHQHPEPCRRGALFGSEGLIHLPYRLAWGHGQIAADYSGESGADAGKPASVPPSPPAALHAGSPGTDANPYAAGCGSGPMWGRYWKKSGKLGPVVRAGFQPLARNLQPAGRSDESQPQLDYYALGIQALQAQARDWLPQTLSTTPSWVMDRLEQLLRAGAPLAGEICKCPGAGAGLPGERQRGAAGAHWPDPH